ncbi:hypothetical protein XELAEV_18031112mg [Xenopus laevis]|uniref:Calpain-7 n=1 Tax=Xenopus laevis TaxID=8355 RepID=A0A974CPC9_XENLA|nr:hypothetical protein XELAEV_18031112mg [Xenopus laevis]
MTFFLIRDKLGKLALSPKQKALFSRWVRPDDITNNPTMIYTVSSISIKQTIVSDCSFVASLAISAAYERRYNKKLITSFYCCHNNELTIANYFVLQNIDLHALTGWIPERIAMHSDNQSFDKESTFTMLYQRFHKGDLLITTATGVMTEVEGEKRGLVPTHAYAVLDIREYKVYFCFLTPCTWDAKQGLVEDAYSLANNPQYKLEVHCPKGGGSDPDPYIDGIRINSPHYLTKMTLTSPGTHTFTLVVSQYEKQNTIHYTLRVYSACKFTFTKIPTPYTINKRINGQWKGQSAGLCGNFRDTHKNNPMYQFQIEKSGPLLIELRGPRQYSVGFEVFTVSTTGDPGSSGFQKKSSGDYRCGFCYMELENIPAGVYNIITTTFLPAQEGPFFLDFNTALPIKVTQLQ